MKETPVSRNYIELHLKTSDEGIFREISVNFKRDTSVCGTMILPLSLILLLGTMMAIYSCWRIYSDSPRATVHFTSYDFKSMIMLIADSSDDFSEFIDADDETNEGASYFGEIKLLDKDYHVSWSKNLNDNDFRSWKGLAKKGSLVEYTEKERLARARRETKPRKYVVPRATQFVSCERFRPGRRGKYLTSASLAALHTCYRQGLHLAELEAGEAKGNGGTTLAELYVPCDEAFLELDELTDELRNDFERCRWAGALSSETQTNMQLRFFEALNSLVQMDEPIKTNRNALDIKNFVECSHVEIEMFEDYFESPSYEALERCQRLGVSSNEIELGKANNPQPDQVRFDANLYIPCEDVFSASIDYMTPELQEDYRRCKSVGALTAQVQEVLEKKFYKALYEEKSTTEKITEKLSTTTTTTMTVTSSIAGSADTSTAPSEPTTEPAGNATATGKRTKANRYAFANCKRIENKAYLICIKIIKVYPSPFRYI